VINWALTASTVNLILHADMVPMSVLYVVLNHKLYVWYVCFVFVINKSLTVIHRVPKNQAP